MYRRLGYGVEHAFGNIGSAFMAISDLFLTTGGTGCDIANETNRRAICNGDIRAGGKLTLAIAENGPGATGLVTAVQETGYMTRGLVMLVSPLGQKDHQPMRLPGCRAAEWSCRWRRRAGSGKTCVFEARDVD